MFDILLYGVWHVAYQRPHHLVRWLKNRGIRTCIVTQKHIFQPPRPEFQHSELISNIRYLKAFPALGRPMLCVRNVMLNVQEKKVFQELVNNIPVIAYNVPHVLPRKAKPLVFDCLDDFSAFHERLDKSCDRRQRNLAEMADLIWCTSRKLYDLWHRLYPEKTHLIPNGADIQHFSGTVEFSPREYRPMLSGKRPMVGYFGAIASWLDRDLLRRVADELPEVQFVLVGPIYRGCDGPWPENVFLFGTQPYTRLPEIVRQWDCCIIPFILNDLTRATNPVKMYEYLAAGKPVVSTPLPEVQAYQRAGIVETAGNPTDFAEAIMRSIESCWDKGLTDERIAIARKNSWEARFKKAYETITPFLPRGWPTP